MHMNAELNHRINYELMLLESARKEYALRLDLLRDYKDACLRRARPRKGKYCYFYLKRKGSKEYHYLRSSDQRVVERVREARFLKEAIRRIDRDIALMRPLVDDFLPYDPGSVNESLPPIYRCDVAPMSEQYINKGKQWLAGRLEFQKKFPENYPHRKGQTTSDRVKVKTISELLLYERFKSAGLIQVYELPLPLKDYGPPLYPDFTILSPVDMKTEILVEFVGRLDKQGYREDFARKVGRYIESGYIPGVNLFFVFGDKDGNIDSTQITRIIAEIKGLRSARMA